MVEQSSGACSNGYDTHCWERLCNGIVQRGAEMNPDEIRQAIYEKREELSRLTRQVWGAPRHIAEEIEPQIVTLNREIDALKTQLYKANGGQ